MIPYSADFEQEYLDNGCPAIADGEPISMVNKIIKQGFKLLDLIYYFTCGADEVKCWTIRE